MARTGRDVDRGGTLSCRIRRRGCASSREGMQSQNSVYPFPREAVTDDHKLGGSEPETLSGVRKLKAQYQGVGSTGSFGG